MNPVVVGIAGGSASGKTTIARAMVTRLHSRALLVAHDRYYHGRSPGSQGARNYDHPDALDTEHLIRDLRRLRSGERTELPRYDFASHDRLPPAEWDDVGPHPIVIVEGILALAVDRLRDELDHRVYVDAPDDLRLMRRIRRDLHERGRELHDVLHQYESTVRPMHAAFVAPSRDHADLVVDGTADIDQIVETLLRTLVLDG